MFKTVTKKKQIRTLCRQLQPTGLPWILRVRLARIAVREHSSLLCFAREISRLRGKHPQLEVKATCRWFLDDALEHGSVVTGPKGSITFW